MAKKVSLKDRLTARLQKLGLTKRKATELAKGIRPVQGNVTEKLTNRLMKLGLSERKAKELAKGLAPTVRSAIKAKAKAKAITLKDVDDDMVEDAVTKATDDADDEELDKVAPRVNGHRLRLDLPVVRRSLWQRSSIRGIEILRVMDGLTSEATYLVAAVKSDEGILAVRQFSPDSYNVKFYPTMAYWGKTQEDLAKLGAYDYLGREWYQRVHSNRDTLDQLLKQLEKEAKPKARMKALLDRMMTVAGAPLVKAFDYLHKRIGVAA